jgi:ABC-type uncharacterized transport system ATPase subunit
MMQQTDVQPVLQSTRVTKRFGGLVAVGDLDLTIMPNQIASVIGPNGAGKTTFFNCISGFYKPEERNHFLGHRSGPASGSDHGQVSPHLQDITCLPDDRARKRAGRHASILPAPMGTRLCADQCPRGRSRAGEAYSLLGIELDKRVTCWPATGVWQPAPPEIARALASDPRLLLLDEPTAA